MLREWFIADDAAILSAIAYDYDYWLVLLAIVIACLTSYSGFETLDRFCAARRRTLQFVWLATGALTLGGGVWSMHSIGACQINSLVLGCLPDTIGGCRNSHTDGTVFTPTLFGKPYGFTSALP